MYGRLSVAAPPEVSVLRRNNPWRKEGRAQRPAPTLILRLQPKTGSYFFTPPSALDSLEARSVS